MANIYSELSQEMQCKLPIGNLRESSDTLFTIFAGYGYAKDMVYQELLNVEVQHMYESQTLDPPRHALDNFGLFSPHKIGRNCQGDHEDVVEEKLRKCQISSKRSALLTLNHTHQIFVILISGNILAMVAFVVELCQKYS